MKWLIALLYIAVVMGCSARYQYKHTLADGSICELTISSARDVQAADISISKECALVGGAESLTVNDKAFDAINVLVTKIP